MEQMITPGQLKRIWASARAIGWESEQLHTELARVIGVDSLQTLTHENASLFIDYLISEGAPAGHWEPSAPARPPRPRPANLIELSTPAQQRYIDGMLRDLGWTREEPYFLGGLKRATGKTRIRTRRDASMAIVFLEKMIQARLNPPQQSQKTPGNGAA